MSGVELIAVLQQIWFVFNETGMSPMACCMRFLKSECAAQRQAGTER